MTTQKWYLGMELKRYHLKRCKKPQFKSGLTQQYRIKIDGQIYKVYQSERSYSVGKKQAGYVFVDASVIYDKLELWYKLPDGWTSIVE
jgi:hypothetical protein